MDQIDQQLATSRKLARVRELEQQPAEIALPELRKLLSPAMADQVVAEAIVAVRGFGNKAAELIPALDRLADNHADTA